MEFDRPSPNNIFDIYNTYGIKLLTRLRLGLSHVNEHKLKHGFNDAINPICICGGDIELINQFFPHYLEYCEARQSLFDKIQRIDKMLLSQNETHLLLYSDSKRNSNVVKRETTVKGTDNANKRSKKVIFKNNALFRSCISKINNIFVDNAEDLDIVIWMYNLLDHKDNYFMRSRSLWNYYRDELNDAANENGECCCQ